jgi:SagB-type dehydrogenase family enzyme
MFRKNYPVAWDFHKNTNRSLNSLFNTTMTQGESPLYKEYPNTKIISLEKCLEFNTKLIDSLQMRISCRNFRKKAISLEQLATVLNYSYGIRKISLFNNSELFQRFTPSGGALYSIELYLIIRNVESVEPGLYHFCIIPPGLELIKEIELPNDLITSLFMNQFYINGASVIILATSMVERTMWKYGDRGYRYILLEAGHIFQNINLIACGLDMASLNIGGFFDEDISKLLNIDPEFEIPVYAIALGISNHNDDNIEVNSY